MKVKDWFGIEEARGSLRLVFFKNCEVLECRSSVYSGQSHFGEYMKLIDVSILAIGVAINFWILLKNYITSRLE